jgi:hypothetical protein
MVLDLAIIKLEKQGQYVRIIKPNGKEESWAIIPKPKDVDKCHLESVMQCGKGMAKAHDFYLDIRVRFFNHINIFSANKCHI